MDCLSNHEARVQTLIEEGLSPAQARREARAEVAMVLREERMAKAEALRVADEERKDARRAQANMRLGVSVFRVILRMLK